MRMRQTFKKRVIIIFFIAVVLEVSDLVLIDQFISNPQLREIAAIISVFLIIFFTFVLIYFLILKKLILNIVRLSAELSLIAQGNLDTVITVTGEDEFAMLSKNVNRMVQNVVRTSGRLSRVIAMVDAPIAVFEFHRSRNMVTVTDRFASILNIKYSELSTWTKDKQTFKTRLDWVMKKPISGESNVYQISERPEKYVRIDVVKEDNDVFGMVMDVTSDIMNKKAIMKERDFDPLTGIRNRLSFQNEVSEMLKRGHLVEGAMIMVDLDKFKSINDTYGHAFGDEYLQCAARFLERFSSQNSIVARRSGDEFCIFLYQFSSKEEIRNLAHQFFQMLNQEPLTTPLGEKRVLGMSLGIAWYSEQVNDYDVLLKEADLALYHVKETTRGDFAERDTALLQQ